MNAIVVVDKNWCIGKDGGLLVHLSKDLKYFKEKTIGKTLIVGRKTLESFPGGKPLPGRKTIMLHLLIALDTTERIAGQSAAFHTHGMNFGHGVGYGTQARHRSERLTSKAH